MVLGPVPSSRTLRVLTDVVLVLAVAAFGVIVWTLVSLRGQVSDQAVDLHHSDTARHQLAEAVAKQQAALDKANQRLVQAGKPPVPTPPAPAPTQTVTVPGPAGATGAQGPRGFSCVEVLGVAACRGPQGPSGEVGVAGPAGKDGATGATGPTGPQGPPPSDDQVAAAVRFYCASHDDCTGPAGEKGDAGPKGDTGATGQPGPAGKDGTAQPGTYSCPDGDYMTGFTVAADGSVTVSCAAGFPGNASGQGATP